MVVTQLANPPQKESFQKDSHLSNEWTSLSWYVRGILLMAEKYVT